MKPLVTDVSDKKQVKAAEQKERLGRDQELNDICSTPQGRRFMWRLLGHCRTFESIWKNSAEIHYNAGQQDLGHFLMSEIVEADQEIYFQMMRENKKEQV